MDGIVSLLAEPFYEQVAQLWAELERRFGLRGIYRTPYPHFSYHVATHYDWDGLTAVLQTLVQETAVLPITMTGLGVFTGAEPVLYMPVVRTAVLSQLHERVWMAVEPVSSGTQAYYSPDNWLPHITLAQHDLTPENLPVVTQWLNSQSLTWQMAVDNVSLIALREGKQVLDGRYPLQARSNWRASSFCLDDIVVR